MSQKQSPKKPKFSNVGSFMKKETTLSRVQVSEPQSVFHQNMWMIMFLTKCEIMDSALHSRFQPVRLSVRIYSQRSSSCDEWSKGEDKYSLRSTCNSSMTDLCQHLEQPLGASGCCCFIGKGHKIF